MTLREAGRHVRLLALTSLVFALYGAISSGYMLSFVSPRTLPLVKAAWGVLLVLALVELKDFGRRRQAAGPGWRAAVLFLPVAAALVVRPTGLSARQAAQRGVAASGYTVRSDTMPGGDTADGRRIEVHLTRAGDIAAAESSLVLDDTTFLDGLEQLYSRPERFTGSAVTVTGFVVEDTTLGPSDRFVARMVVTCCAADAMPVGLYCRPGKSPFPRQNEGVTVSGVVTAQRVKFPWGEDTTTVPVLMTRSVRRVPRPGHQYVFPR